MFPIPEEALDTALSSWETTVFALLLLLLLFFFFAITEGVLLDAGLKSDLALLFCGVAETNSSEEEEAVEVDFWRAEEEKGDFLGKKLQPQYNKDQRNKEGFCEKRSSFDTSREIRERTRKLTKWNTSQVSPSDTIKYRIYPHVFLSPLL